MNESYSEMIARLLKRRDIVLAVLGIALITFIMSYQMNDDFKAMHDAHLPNAKIERVTESNAEVHKIIQAYEIYREEFKNVSK